MPAENCLIDALEVVLTWDLPEELLPLALPAQAGLLAGIPYEDLDCCLH
ncbi:MAG: hypothetical protein AB1593_03945 [Pseudomonadota bacterium]